MGGLVGTSDSSTVIRDSHAQGTTLTATGSDYGVGGFVGYGSGTIYRSSASLNVSISPSPTPYIGGFVGYQGGNIFDSFSTGNVTGGDYTGGFSGIRDGGTIYRSFSTGNVVGGNYTGGFGGSGVRAQYSFSTGTVTSSGSDVAGFVGTASSGNFTDVYWFDSDGDDASACYDGGSPGNTNCTERNAESGGISYFYDALSAVFSTWDFNNVWLESSDNSDFPTLRDLTYPSTTLSGAGTEADPYLISTEADLDQIVNNPDVMTAYFRLTADITLTSARSPIGSAEFPFSGVFDGNDRTIADLDINGSGTDNRGLFAVGAGAKVYDLTFTGADVVGAQYTGTVFGRCYGCQLENVHVTGAVDSESDEDGGGIVGWASGTSFEYVSFTGTVDGSAVLGGLAGTAQSSNIRRSFAVITLTADAGTAGGLVGTLNSSLLINSYATGSITDDNRAGGLVGWAQSGTTIRNCYSTVNVSGDAGQNDMGGIAGKADSTDVENCFSTGTVVSANDPEQIVGDDSGGNVTVTNSVMDTNAATFLNSSHAVYVGTPAWDFTDVWVTPAAALPTLLDFTDE